MSARSAEQAIREYLARVRVDDGDANLVELVRAAMADLRTDIESEITVAIRGSEFFRRLTQLQSDFSHLRREVRERRESAGSPPEGRSREEHDEPSDGLEAMGGCSAEQMRELGRLHALLSREEREKVEDGIGPGASVAEQIAAMKGHLVVRDLEEERRRTRQRWGAS